ncbi:mitochondrial import translocase, subunit Tom22 [Gloeophyllum trabeum ATCC 11539]|uniref:Mitochondrial import translocase, subunit Tom22 n=1 Tax=Gloeophyllum trabeum (strain ATCC 11539 / FP-39264 / Madison 617) TaxID=670483 RepID=S7PUQ3_GLOTA|nr:mitochondrial import translocase, subunit Tom22 [Gloeophyllum trabeum ATCC 11539]EPQ50997.1 mitochondrial import translocase, subunit Tom22 [Gloeophyllum trabeum ATCC 11539]
MVKVEIVEDKDQRSAGSSPYSSPSSSRTSSSASLSSVSSELDAEETFFERVSALVDIIPPTTRHAISTKVSNTASFLKRGGKLAGNLVWIITTSALLVGLPLAMSLEDEAKIVAEEKEMLARQQGAQQMISGVPGVPGSSPDMSQPKSLVPPGF